MDTVNLDLGVAGAGDGAADAVVVNTTTGVDVISIAGGAKSVTLTRPSPTVAIANSELTKDTLTVNALAGSRPGQRLRPCKHQCLPDAERRQ